VWSTAKQRASTPTKHLKQPDIEPKKNQQDNKTIN
jgi:hypothetical protein